MSERIVADANTDVKFYPLGVTPEPYVPPWERQKPDEK